MGGERKGIRKRECRLSGLHSQAPAAFYRASMVDQMAQFLAALGRTSELGTLLEKARPIQKHTIVPLQLAHVLRVDTHPRRPTTHHGRVPFAGHVAFRVWPQGDRPTNRISAVTFTLKRKNNIFGGQFFGPYLCSTGKEKS